MEPKIIDRYIIGGWDFNRLPSSLFNEVRELIEAKDISKLFDIHNKYTISNHKYCCPGEYVLEYFSYAMNNLIPDE